MSDAVITAVAAVAVAILGALLGSSLNARAKRDDGLRQERLRTYPGMWAATSEFSRWPRNVQLTWLGVQQTHQFCRKWYYETGGLFLSERTRGLYGDVQELIAALLLAHQSDRPCRVSRSEYSDLMNASSRLRTGMTQDLETREPRALFDVRRRRKQKAEYESARELTKEAIRKAELSRTSSW